MIYSFSDKQTELIFKGFKSTEPPVDIQNSARRKLRMIAAAKAINDLRIPPGNRLEHLKGNLADFWSIRINDQWRIIFSFENGGAFDVRIADYH